MTFWTLYGLFFKYGVLCVGGGYVLIPMLMADLVGARQIMTGEEFARLVALAQVTPGPIGINAATYTGFRELGVSGGIVGTAGLLTPALIMVLGTVIFLRRHQESCWVRGTLNGLRPAAFGLVLAAVWVVGKLAVHPVSGGEWRWIPGLIAIAVFLLQLRTKISFLWLIAGSAVIGAFLCR